MRNGVKKRAVGMALWCFAIGASPAFSATIEETLRQKMRHLAGTQSVIARNIANADVPGYKAMKAAPFAEAAQGRGRLAPVALAATSPLHITRGAASSVRAEPDPDAGPAKPNGNNVSLERQSLEMNRLALQHQEATGLSRKVADLYRAALGEAR
jgi:flagellar basal-body rod protein FlgB